LLWEAHIPGTEDAMTTANGQHDSAAEAVRLAEAEQARIAENIRRVRDAVELDLYGQLGYTDPDDLRAGFGDGFGFGGTLPPYRKQSDKRGEQVAVYVDENQLQRIRDRSRKLCAENEFAICAVENRKSYLVGKGFTYTAGPRPDTDCPPLLVKQTQAVLDAFGELNDLGDLEQELVGRCDRDGEAFIRLFPGEDALLKLRWVEPEHVRAPSGEGWGPELSFGIETPPRDVETERAFWIVEQPLESQQPARVPGEQVIHVKWNVDRNVKRGIPTFYAIDQNLRWAEELLASMTALAKTRAKIAALRKVSGASKQFVENLLASLTDTKATDATTGAAISMEKLRFGSIITHNQNVEWAFPNAEIAASDFVAVLQAVLRSAAARVVMPEWMFTADASNNNLASALIAGDPAARNFERLQHGLKRKLGEGRHRQCRSLVWRQLAYSVRRGVLPQAVFDLVDVQVEAPTLVIRDKKEEADTNKVYFDMKAKSRKTIQQEQSLDPDQEDANFEEDSQTEWLQPKAPAVGPGDQQAGGKDPAGEDDGKGDGKGGSVREDFNPSEPRDNQGRWTTGGGGGVSAQDPAANRPTRPEERKDVSPPSLPEKYRPPSPLGQSRAPKNAQGRPVTGYTASGLTNTAFGDMVEAFTEQLGFRSILPAGRRSNKSVAEEGSSIDVEYDHSGYAMEVKAVCVEATEYKAKPKKEEMEGKRAFAERHRLKPAMMLIVTDVNNGEAHAYWREGIGAYALNPNNLEAWNYAGKITFPPVKVGEAAGAKA
jgi:hypothetical protein